MSHEIPQTTTAVQFATSATLASPAKSWSDRYGDRHKLERIMDFPRGITPPLKVRIYCRRDHYVLQWWDRHAKRTLSDRVNDDLVAAIARSREIERRMQEVGRSGLGRRTLTFPELIDAILADTAERADSGELDPRTVVRYRSALRYLRDFCER